MTRRALGECDHLEGVTDSIISNPRSCPFDIAPLAYPATSNNTSARLTAAELATARAVYGGARDARTGALLYPGHTIGSESC